MNELVNDLVNEIVQIIAKQRNKPATSRRTEVWCVSPHGGFLRAKNTSRQWGPSLHERTTSHPSPPCGSRLGDAIGDFQGSCTGQRTDDASGLWPIGEDLPF